MYEGRWTWTQHFLRVICLLLLAAAPPTALGYFLGDTKAVLNGCEDHWTLPDRSAMPLLFQMTVCVDIRVVRPGAWVAFSYSSVYAPKPELGLEGDDGALYGWLLRVRHRFPLRLSPTVWHRVCLRRDVRRNSFSLEVDGAMVAERTVIAPAIAPSGSLRLGCRPRDRLSGAERGEVELYLFRMWADLGDHGLCEDGTVIGWDTWDWRFSSLNARQTDPNLLCAHRRLRRRARVDRSACSKGSSDSNSKSDTKSKIEKKESKTLCKRQPAKLLEVCQCDKKLKEVDVSCKRVSAQQETHENKIQVQITMKRKKHGQNLCQFTISLEDFCQSCAHSCSSCPEPSTIKQRTTQPPTTSDITRTSEALTPTVSQKIRQTNTTTDKTTAGHQKKESQGTAVNLTTKDPGVDLTTTTPANAYLEHTSTISSTTPIAAATASTTSGPPPTQSSTTSADVSSKSTTTLQTTTLTRTTTTTGTATTISKTMMKTTIGQEAQEEQANELLNQTQDASQLNSSQVGQLVGQLEKLLDGPTVSQSVGQKAIGIISNLKDGDPVALSASANRLIRVVDSVGLKAVVSGDREILSSNSLVLAIRTVDGTNFTSLLVNIFNSDNVQIRAVGRSGYKRSGSALGSVFLPSTLTAGLSPEQQQQASRVQFTFHTKNVLFQDKALGDKTLVSSVLGASVANLSISNLTENILFTIRNINPMPGNFVASCAFWDFTVNDGQGGWSSAGCFVVNATSDDTTCSCNHLTSFAILLDLSRDVLIDRQHAQILTFVTYIGCGISAIFLAVTLLTYLSFEKLLRDIPAKILVQLCLSLLLLNLVFLLDGWLALYPAIGLCISTAFFLHYFLLTSFTWAGLEALHMYLSIVQVFTPYLSRYMLKFSLMGWGIPLLVVIIIISVDKDNYGLVTYGKYSDGTSDDFCWLLNDIAFYVGVVAYFLLVFVLCLLVFVVVMVQLSRIKKRNPQNQSPNRGVLTDLRSVSGLVVLLGLTWGFALFAWGPLYIPFVYLFTIFNSLQGFLVFVFHCAVKENVRRQWRTYLCCGRLRLAENSEWSHKATQNNRTLSTATAFTSGPHSTSGKSSVVGEGTNSSAEYPTAPTATSSSTSYTDGTRQCTARPDQEILSVTQDEGF
ncbi:adhesion G-protein coupled receptor G2-like isoform X2 [Scophthalmus maximus]|uniref:adhesion G-protein coupled receptor G2-like isoform X2 n=1 Tax=Scophthalmus maximus TaxID=52904 RepID=UPI001FA8E9CB|nr:adhesion G-protein coupled receptor G2-like isoform X2 [Scophthalmus maximus]